jgi:hypothetical protein
MLTTHIPRVTPKATPSPTRIDADLTQLSLADLHRVQTFIEDRFVNAVVPLATYLQMPDSLPPSTDLTRSYAQATVQKVMQIVNEVRRLVPDTPHPDRHPHRQHPDA